MPKQNKGRFDDYKFRPSMLPLLMTQGRSKDGSLSQTVKSALSEIYITEIFSREKVIVSKYMEKGNNKEDESIRLYRKINQVFAQKNEDKFENKFLIGTPDLVLDDKIVDVKTCWDIWSFHSKDEKSARSDYYYQLVAYMILTGKKKAELAYCLVDNDEADILSELRKIQYQKGLAEESEELEAYREQLYINNTYDDIAPEKRIKVYSFELDDDEIAKIQTQLQKCREYLNTISL